MVNRGAPTPATPLPDGAEVRLRSRRIEIAASVLVRLQGACASVSTDPAELAEHGRDWWPLTIRWAMKQAQIPSLPAVVCQPSTIEEVVSVLSICNDAGVPVTAMAGRSGVVGGSLPVHGGVALDLCGLAGIVAVDDAALTVEARAGTFGDVLEDELRTRHGLTTGHWPQSIALSTVGGWAACRGAGQYSTRYGKIEDIVSGLEVVLADGRVIRTGGRAPREASGPDLNQLFIGSEGTLGVITAVRMRVHPVPTGELRAAYGFTTFALGLEACRRILRRGATPAVLRLYDDRESARSFDTGKPGSADALNVLLVRDEADPLLVDAVGAIVDDVCRSADLQASVLDAALVERWMGHRNDVSQLESVIANDIVVDTIEVAGSWSALPRIHEAVTATVLAIPGAMICSCHQSHAYGDGACLYFTVAGRRADADSFYSEVWDAATRTTLAAGGALSHHHGVGLNRSRFMRATLGAASEVLASVKDALDPRGILNPGKLGFADPFGPVSWP